MKYAGRHPDVPDSAQLPDPAVGHVVSYYKDVVRKGVERTLKDNMLYNGSGIPCRAAVVVREVTADGFLRVANTPRSEHLFERGRKHAAGPEDRTLWPAELFTFVRTKW